MYSSTPPTSAKRQHEQRPARSRGRRTTGSASAARARGTAPRLRAMRERRRARRATDEPARPTTTLRKTRRAVRQRDELPQRRQDRAADSAGRAAGTTGPAACGRAERRREATCGRDRHGHPQIAKRMITDYRVRSPTMKLPTARSLFHRLHSRRTGTGSVDRRDHHADLSDVDLRAGRARPAQGLRVRAHAESDAVGARSQSRGHRRRPRRRSRSRPACPRSTRSPRGSSTGDHVVVTDNTYGGTFRLFDKVLTRYGIHVQLRRHVGPGGDRARDHAGDEAGLRRDADQSGPAADGHRGRRRRSRIGTARSSPSTTRSRARACSGRSRSAPISSCTARRST